MTKDIAQLFVQCNMKPVCGAKIFTMNRSNAVDRRERHGPTRRGSVNVSLSLATAAAGARDVRSRRVAARPARDHMYRVQEARAQ
jgi:hypothetical protein